MASYRIEDKYNGDPVSGVVVAPITKNLTSSRFDSEAITVDIVYEDATIVGAVTAKIQSSIDGGTNWDFEHGSVVITAATATRTVKTIDLNMERAGDQADLPLRSIYRVVMDSDNAGNSVTVDNVYISRRVSQ